MPVLTSQCTWPPDDPVQRRKNRPRKQRTHSVSEPKRRFKLPFHAPEAFVSSLPPLGSVKGKEREAELVPESLRAEMMMDPCVSHPPQ
jgi:hypothetical protein